MAVSGPSAPSPARRVSNPLSLTRVETAVARSVAGFGVAFLLQSVPAIVAQQSLVNPVYFAFSVALMVASLSFAGIAAIIRRGVRVASISFAVVYLLLLISWPFAFVGPQRAAGDSPWLYYMLTVATAMAAVGVGIRLAVAYLLIVPTIYAFIRILPAGGAATILQAILNSAYAVILGGVITIIFTILRSAARSVDRAQDIALERYSYAVRHYATEAERVQVDAIVHDSVLTTLLSAARAFTPEAKQLAATMAGNAIGYLRDSVTASLDSDAVVSGSVVAHRISEAARSMPLPITVRVVRAEQVSMPPAVVEAIYSAAVQAMVNSLQHAGEEVERWVSIRGADDGSFEVEIGDRGTGFDLATIPTERLGVRVSILERMETSGGRAMIDSRPGRGTTVALRWPDEHSAGAPEFAGFVAEIERADGERA